VQVKRLQELAAAGPDKLLQAPICPSGCPSVLPAGRGYDDSPLRSLWGKGMSAGSSSGQSRRHVAGSAVSTLIWLPRTSLTSDMGARNSACLARSEMSGDHGRLDVGDELDWLSGD
jgi:hypothetical protein